MKATRILVGAAALALAATGCTVNGSGDAETAGSSPASPPAESTSPSQSGSSAAEQGAETVEIDVADFAFKKGTVTVQAGTTVVWTNQDAVGHTVTAGSAAEPQQDQFDLDLPDKGSTVEVTFDEPGEYPYFCKPHPFMQGTITVEG
jgi:plastocyanin